ncbi:hypothetical protein AAE478_007427 [Parahypoxylon ruwenzoriense]
MATPGTTQALLGAFFFGILFNAASAALVLYIIGHGSAIFRDGLRLVLISFLASSAIWALVEFLATVIEPTAASTCQVAVIFSSIFDQFGRVFIEQYLVWAVRSESKSILALLPQILILARFGVGMAFVGLTGSDFNPTCVPVSKVLPVAATVIAMDAVIIGLVATQAFSGSAKDGNRQIPRNRKSVTLVNVGLAIWTGMSGALLLGMKTTELVFKTTLPALGLAILVALVTVLSGTLIAPRGPPPPRPDSPTSRDIGTVRDLSSSDSAGYPPSRYEDVKSINARSMSAYVTQADGGISVPTAQMTGTGGISVQGMTQPGFSALSVLSQTEMGGSQKKNVKRSAWAKASGGKLTISRPVLMEAEGMGNPLNRIPTVDLATAATNEKERRNKLAQQESNLIAQRPAPLPPNTFEQDVMVNREVSLKRKEVAPSSSEELERSISTKTTKTTKTAGGLSVEANASSTSSELSPGAEKVRRRSPRQSLAPPIPAAFQPVRPGEPIRIPIPRPREPSEPPKVPELVKTPLQRRATTGLPSNPRAQAMKAMSKEAKSQRQETVMFVNSIVYDDPNVVSDIVQGASKTPITSLDSANSVVNRPRPIPRKGDKDRQVFPAELSPTGHRRSKSGGSLGSRKSILQSMPGSPTQLPPLPPPPPKSAGNAQRSLPNDTKSMTFDEKMDILYAAPQGAPSGKFTTSKRRSGVPEMPSVPAEYAADTQPPIIESTSDPEMDSERRGSKTTDRSSVRTTSVLGIEDIPQRYTQHLASSRNATDELGQSWLPGISVGDQRSQRPSRDKSNRRSSPVIPAASHFSISSTGGDTKARDEDSKSVWDSVYSPVAAVAIQQSRINARSTYIRKNSQGSEKQPEQIISSTILDEAVTTKPEDILPEHTDNNQESPPGDDIALHQSPAVEHIGPGQFHHRIGEDCPTFSTRKDKRRLRKMPPPAPLILHGNNTKRAIIVQAAEPSPLESPEAAYQMIQAQLQRFEQPNRESVESQGQHLALLENLELEMGQLQNKWQSSQNRLGHDSMSSINTSPSKDSRPGSMIGRLSIGPSQRTIAERRASRRSALRQSSVLQSKDEEGTSTASSQSSGLSSESTRASVWQARLAEAQMEYMKSTPELIMKRNNLNFLSVSKAALGSPSPPDTDESDSEAEVQKSLQPPSPKLDEPVVQLHELWRPQSPAGHSLDSGLGLWAAPVKKQEVSEARELPSLSVRPAIRKIMDPLKIESSLLWQKPVEMGNSSRASGLWKKIVPSREALESSRSTARPATTRPARKNKRVTLLPDILENPEPLPDKRGTLGLFQFPWGEKSEHPTIQPRPSGVYMAMPGTMTTGGPALKPSLDAKSRLLEAEEFTTSFFDDYEAEEEGDNFDFSGSDGEGDDFDESTLWEIASLLKAENVPSKKSLFPFSQQTSASANTFDSVDYINEVLAEADNDEDVVSEEEPIPVDPSSPSTAQVISAQPLLWAQSETLEINTVGLPQPDSAIWNGYIAECVATIRSHPHPEEVIPIQSSKLWAPTTKDVGMISVGLLWNMSKSLQRKALVPAEPSLLWMQPTITPAAGISGLFDASHSRADYRRTSKGPAALSMTRKPRAVEEPLEKLISKTLWTGSISTEVPSLWEKPATLNIPEQDGLFDSNVSRSSYRRTAKEPAAISMAKMPRTTKEPLTVLETISLWSKEVLVSSPIRGAQLFTSTKSALPVSQQVTTALWVVPEARLEPKHQGLFDANVTRYNYRRTSKIPAAISMATKPRPGKESLPILASTSLWTGETLEKEVFVAIPKSLTPPTEALASTRSNLLWEELAPAASGSDYEGLFDASIIRTDYRRTSKLPAAVNMTRKPRQLEEPLPSLESAKLWEAQSVSVSSSKTVTLWGKPATSAPIALGLFQLDSERKVYRTTSAEPAALQMVRKPRLVNKSLPRIESTRLWINSQVTSVELDWISISSVRPQSPSVASVSTESSAPSSPVTDSSSVKTSTTKASSSQSFFSGWFGRKRKGSEGSESTPNDIPAVPELPKEFVVKNLGKTPRQIHRSGVAYHADWDRALREAIAASYPGTVVAFRASYPQDWEAELQAAIKASHMVPNITRKPSSPRDWYVALHEAISASYPEIRFSRGQTLPAQWDAALQEAIAKSQLQQPAFDVAVCHPVFFGSLETTAETVHPAIGPKVLKRKTSASKAKSRSGSQSKSVASVVTPVPLLWTKPAAQTSTAIPKSLWTPGSSIKVQPASFPEIKADVPRSSPRRSGGEASGVVEVDADFGKQGMWKRASSSEEDSQGRDWLDDSMKKRFSRIELRY